MIQRDSDYNNKGNNTTTSNRQQLNPLQQATNNLYATVKAKAISSEEVSRMISDRYKKKSSKELSLQEVQDMQKFIAGM